MSDDPKKKKPVPKPEPKSKPQEPPSSQFAEVRAAQEKTPQPEQKKTPKITSRVNVWGEREYAPGHHPPKKSSGGRRGGGGGGRQDMSPLPPNHDKPKTPVKRDLRGTLGGSINPGTTKQDWEMYRRNYSAWQDKQQKRFFDPEYQYRRRLWDLQMAKVGLTPEGKQLGGIRASMIERMNQLRSGR